MAGTSEGARKAARTLKEKFGDDYFGKIGAKGGKHAKQAFSVDREFARKSGKKGGRAKKGYRKET